MSNTFRTDRVELVVNDEVLSPRNKLGDQLYGYEIKWSVFDQPSAFSFRMGWERSGAELAARFPPGSPCALQVRTSSGSLPFMVGQIEAAIVKSDPATTVEFRGRDYMNALYRGFVLDEMSLSQKTYVDLTRKVLDLAGLSAFHLAAENSENVALAAGPSRRKRGRNFTAEVTKLSTGAGAGISEVVQISLKTRLGERWVDFLNRQLKLAGLFLWCGPSVVDGSLKPGFILTRPNATADPHYNIVRKFADANDPRLKLLPTNVISAEFASDATGRHDGAMVYGRGGGTKSGRRKIHGEFIDQAMVDAGLFGAIVIHDDDAKTASECEYVARRIIAEERRQALKLRYTIAGHTFGRDGGFGMFVPDIVVRVHDEPLGLVDRNFYVHSVTYRLSNDTGSTTSLEMMPTSSLVFAEKLFNPSHNDKGGAGSGHGKRKPTKAEELAAQAAAFESAVRAGL